MFKKKDRKYILAHGCSFTDFNFQSVEPEHNPITFPKWPEILGERLGVPVTNLARSGNDNDTIINETIDHILKDKPWLVVIGLTDITRFRMYGNKTLQAIPSWMMDHHEYFDDMQGDKSHDKNLYPWIEWFWKSCQTPKDQHVFYNDLLERTFDYHYKRVIRLQKICDRLGVKLIMTHLLPLVAHQFHFKDPAKMWGMENKFSYTDLQETMSRPQSFYEVDAKTCFGWPHMIEIGQGYHVLDENRDHPLAWRRPDYVIDFQDGHPNKLGHEIIAEHYYQHYLENYNYVS